MIRKAVLLAVMSLLVVSVAIAQTAATHPTEKINFVIPLKVDRITINDYEDLLADVKQ
jgi:hypothetical protein